MNKNLKQPKLTGGTSTHRNNLVMSFLRTFLFLAVMAIGTGSAWGQISLGKAEISGAPGSSTGWQTISDQSNVKAWYKGTATEFTNGAKEIDGKWFVKLSDEGFIKIRVAKGSVVAGDILRVETIDIYQDGKPQDLGFKVAGSDGTVTFKETDNALHTLDYTLKAADIVVDPDDSNYDYIQFDRNGYLGCGYHSVEILTGRLSASDFKAWSDIEGNTSTGAATCAVLGTSVDAGGTVFGDGNVYYLNYVNVKGGTGTIMRDAKYLIIEGNAGVVVRILFNRKTADGTKANGNMEEEEKTIPSNGILIFDISSYETFHLNAIKIPHNGSTGNIVNSVKISNSLETYTVSVNRTGLPTGCDAYFTIGSDATHYTTAQTVPVGTQVTYTMSSTDPHYTPSGWRTKPWEDPDYGWMGYSASFTTTVRSAAAGTETNEQRLFGNLNPTPEFDKFFFVRANAETGGTAIVTDASGHDTSERYDKTTGELTFTATPATGYTFDGWYNTAGTKVGTTATWNSGTYGTKNSDVDLVYTAKFVSAIYTPSCDWGGTGYTQVLSPTSANAGIAPFSVKMGGVTVDKADYTLSYSVKSGPISVTADGKITVNSESASVKALKDGYSTPVDAYITVTANPNNASYTAGSVDLHVQIKAVTNGTVKLNPSEVRIGDYFDVTIERGTGFPNIKYYWTFPANTTNVYGYNGDAIVQTETTKNGVAIPYQFLATGATSGKMDIYVRIESPNTATEYKGLYGSGITIKPITIPTIDQEGSDIIINYEEDFVNRKNEEVDAFLEYWIGEKIDANKHQTGFGNTASTFKLENQPAGTVITAKSVVRFKKPDNPEEFVYVSSDEVTYTVRKPFQAITVNGTERQYDLYKPEGITGTVGVVLSLHRGGEDVSEGKSGRVYFNDVADAYKDDNDKKFVVVSPRALIRNGVRNWQLDETSADDTEFFKAIVKDINDKDNGLTVDYSRVYLAGYSDGGAMAFKVAHKDADFYAAIASVSGVPYDNNHLWHAGKKPVPFLFIQGANDGIFKDQIGTKNVTTIAHNMVYRNGAAFETTAGSITLGNTHKTVTNDCHEAEAGGAAFYHYTVDQMWHQSDADWNNDSKDDLAPTVWAFFNKNDKVKSLDETLKFRVNDSENFWNHAADYGFENVNTGTSVLTYGGATKTEGNKNIYHSLQFDGGINGAPHFLKLNVTTNKVQNENPNEFFLVKLTKTGDTTPVFAKRYQAGRGQKDLYINFVALPGFNEYKLEITKSSSELVVEIHGMEFYSGRCEDKSQEENPTAFYDVATVLKGMNPIYQPVFDKSYAGIAKEFLPIADIPVGVIPDDDPKHPSDIPTSDYRVINDDLVGNAALTSLPSTVISSNGWTENDGRFTATITGNTLFNIAKSGKTGEDEGIKSKNAFIFDKNSEGYTIDRFKGLCISQHGRAEMPEYLNGTRGAFPDHGVIAIKLQGTLDFYLLAQNEVTYDGTDPNSARRTLKVYYTNDQLDGELKELKEWWFFGTRSEDGYNDKNGQSLVALSAGVRLPQLGMDGTCTVFITYEGREKGAGPFYHYAEDADKIWIKGFVIKRPDLKVTIGRTDSKYSSQDYKGEDNTKCTRFGENKPYVWSFENVGFNNTKKADITQKKINAKDGRTYVCGGTDDSNDHVLLYSDGASVKNEDKVQFDGRVAGQEHIEFLKASQYNIPEATDARKIYDPIQSNGLKVNVTGSGWFKIQCAAPNGPVNMKVYTQPNYGESYISLLREFKVEPVAQGDLKTGETTETAFREYTVYLKSRGIHDGNNGFWDGETADAGKEEIMRQSLFVVFDEVKADNGVDTYSYAEGHPQLNIHQLSWLNEEPADYVFQREEDPKLLTEWQEIKRNDKTVLYWKAGNDDDAAYTVLKGHEKGSYNVINQINTDNASKGVKSPDGYASTSVPSDAGAYNAYWDIAAPARVNALVEKAYGNDQKQNDTQYAYNNGNNTEFDTPVSGSFIRISAMQNTYVVAHVIPGNTSVDANATPHSGATVYVLDETGNPIPSSSSDLNASRLGYIAAMVNGGIEQDGGVASQDKTIRIDICANAGKEYFICAKDASISLARLEVHDWRYNPAKGETLALTDNKNNSTAIATAYDAGNYYMDATLTRTFAAGKWASLVLPFSLNEQKFKEVFGENAKCIHFTDVDKDNNIVKLTHHYYNMIVAGRPVFIYTPKQLVNPQFKDITLQTKDVKNTTTESGFTFHASYDGTQMKWNDLYMNNANAIKYVSNDKSKQLTYPGMRSFIQSPNNYNPSDGRAGSVGAKAVFLSFLDDDYQDIPTGIEELISAEFGEDVVVVTKTTKIYDLLGNVMGEGSDINSLPAGIYIVNGKKYIVK